MTPVNPTLGVFMVAVFGSLFLSIVHMGWWTQYIYAKHFLSAPLNGSTYDYIVVGSGSAGSVVAARLAEAGHGVLLLEAGGPTNFMLGIPAFAPLFPTSPYDWDYEMKLQDDIGGVYNDRIMHQPRGKGLGGCSMNNAMIYARGHSKDYDEWEEMGNTGWSFKDVLPYFKKSERFIGNVKEIRLAS